MHSYLTYISETRKNPHDHLQAIKKVSRDARLEHEYMHGKPRSKVFGGKPNTKTDRRNTKKQLRDGE